LRRALQVKAGVSRAMKRDKIYQTLSALYGDHAHDRGAQVWNWLCCAWVPVVLSFVIAGAVESAVRGRKDIHLTPFVITGTALGSALGIAYIRAFNAATYRFTARSAEQVAPWPLKRWRVFEEEIEALEVVSQRSFWFLQLRLRDGSRKRIPTTRSMRHVLHLT